jgi:putative flippase GtrA
MEGLAGAVIGSYRLMRYLGSGGYGEVFLAQQPASAPGSHIALKALRADASDSAISALLRSAQAIAQMSHPNVLPVFAAGIDGSAAYVAMPYLPLGSIETLLHARPDTADQRGVSAALVAPIVTQASSALSVAHAAGLVHGDLKPGNIFLHAQPGQAPLTLVSDFGQAALVRAALAGGYPISTNAQHSPTELASQLAAPEQLTDAPIPASDQYTLAAIACLLLTGRYPQQPNETIYGASRLSAACAALLPPSVVPVLRQALAADPARRFADITTFASALDAALADAKGIALALPRTRKVAPAPIVLSDHRAPAAPAASTAPSDAEISYAPTGIALADRVLARAEQITHGKAGVLQRAFTYVFIGGIAAVINLIMLYLVYNVLALPLASNLHWLIGFLVAAEVSTMANFVLNDRITFSHLPGHARSWGARCLRFHSTSAAGTIATLVMSFAFKTWLGMTALIAEAVAILLALGLNFTMHHLWTYRHLKDDDGQSGQPREALALAAQEAQGRAG